MTKIRLTLILLAVLTALMLAGCGRTNDSQLDSSSPEGIQTFGVQVDPSAQPSMGQVMPEILEIPDESQPQQGATTINGQDAQTNHTTTEDEAPDPPGATTPSTKPSSTTKPSTSSSSSSPSASPSPTIAPPAPVSSAAIEDVEAFVGHPLSELIDELGYPSRSDYEPVDMEDLSKGELGTLYFNGFTVSTRRIDGTETIISVTPDPVASEEAPTSPSPSA